MATWTTNWTDSTSITTSGTDWGDSSSQTFYYYTSPVSYHVRESVGEAPAPKPEGPLAWLNRRVEEMRVAL